MPKTSGINALPALINLLDDPDEKAFGLVREQIILMGDEAIAPLSRVLEGTFNTMVQERIGSVIRQLQQEDNYRGLVKWLEEGASDLLEGFILVSKNRHPELDEKDIRYKIEKIRVDIWIELHENLTALENVKVLNHLLFDVHHFDGNRNELSAPDNSCINSLLESKKGSPLSLGMLYIILARKLGLPVYGVNLPQHFILAYLVAGDIENPGEKDILFYINPYNHGAVFTRREIELFVGQLKIRPDRSFFVPCNNADMIRRLISNLLYSYSQSGDEEKIMDLKKLLTAFK